MRNYLADKQTSHGSTLLPMIAAYCALSLSSCLTTRSVDQQNIITQRNEYRDTCNGQPIHTYETIDPSITARYYNAGPIEVIVYAWTDGNRSVQIRDYFDTPDTIQNYNVTFYPDMVNSLVSVPADRVGLRVSREHPFLKGRNIERICITPKNDGTPHTIDITLGGSPSAK